MVSSAVSPSRAQENDAVVSLSARRDDIAFFLAGLFNNLVYVVYLSAAEDLMSSKAGVVLLCNVLPGLLVKLALPLFAHKFPYFARVAVTALSLCSCCIGVATTSSTALRLACICVSSASGALGEATFLSLTSMYNPTAIGYWSSGTGMAGLLGSVTYYLFHVQISLSSSQTLLAISPFSLIVLLAYSFILSPSRAALSSNSAAVYARVPSSPQALQAPDSEPQTRVESRSGWGSYRDPYRDPYRPVSFPEPPQGMSARRQALPWLIGNYITPLMLVYVSEYVINQGIAGTLDRFGGEPRPDAAQASHLYVLFQTSYQLGVFLSRSSIEFVKFPWLWLLPVAQGVNLLVLLSAARWEFLPNRYFVTVVMFWEGIVGGGTYVNAFYKLRRTVPAELKAWALGAASVGDAAGITLAAVVNIWLECAIRTSRGETTCNGHKSI